MCPERLWLLSDSTRHGVINGFSTFLLYHTISFATNLLPDTRANKKLTRPLYGVRDRNRRTANRASTGCLMVLFGDFWLFVSKFTDRLRYSISGQKERTTNTIFPKTLYLIDGTAETEIRRVVTIGGPNVLN